MVVLRCRGNLLKFTSISEKWFDISVSIFYDYELENYVSLYLEHIALHLICDTSRQVNKYKYCNINLLCIHA